MTNLHERNDSFFNYLCLSPETKKSTDRQTYSWSQRPKTGPVLGKLERRGMGAVPKRENEQCTRHQCLSKGNESVELTLGPDKKGEDITPWTPLPDPP